MALEFASKKETFPRYKVFETELAGRPFVVETGKMCGLSNGSGLVRYGETAVLCNVTMSAVSYTHLDVYKRQVLHEGRIDAVFRAMGEATEEAVPVYYTHLDVYKRQALARMGPGTLNRAKPQRVRFC